MELRVEWNWAIQDVPRIGIRWEHWCQEKQDSWKARFNKMVLINDYCHMNKQSQT